MTSLRERFIDAEKQQKLNKKTYNQLDGLSGELAAFAALLPRTLEELVIRAEAGQPIRSVSYDPAVRTVFKTAYYAPFSIDYNGRRTYPGREEMAELQGYRKLLDTCADPANDVCLRLAFSRPNMHRTEISLTVDILINEPFSASAFTTEGPGRQQEHHQIGTDYIAAHQKPFKPPVMLSLKAKA